MQCPVVYRFVACYIRTGKVLRRARGYFWVGPAHGRMTDEGLRRLFVSVERTQIFGPVPSSLGSLTVSATAGADSRRACSDPKAAGAEIVWNWNVQITPTAGCTEVIVALNKRTFLGGVDVLGLVAVPLSALWDQLSHSFQLPISAATPKDPRERRERIGEIIMSLRYADYEALRQHLMGSEIATQVAFENPAVQPLIGASTSSSSSSSSSSSHAFRPPPPIAVPASPPTRAANAARAARSSVQPWASHGEEVGFVYQDMNSHAELLHEKAEILASRTEAAGARFARNLLRASVQRLVDKRRLVATELRRMENERASLSTQLALLHQQAADAFGELPDQMDPIYATIQLLDEAEARHAERLAERRKAHLSTVGTLQTEYIGALRDIRNEAVRTGFEPDRVHEPIATLATNDSSAWPTGSPNLTLAERYNALQRQVFVLETQLQQQRDAILQRDAALAEAESQALKYRGVAVVADERAVAAERRAAEAEAMAKATRSELGRTRDELQALRKVSEGLGRSSEAWKAEREGLVRAAAEAEDRWNREAAVARIEHERAMRSLEEDLAFETASREFDRREAQQLNSALRSQQRGQPSLSEVAPPLGAEATPPRKPPRPKLPPSSGAPPAASIRREGHAQLPAPSDRLSGRSASTPRRAVTPPRQPLAAPTDGAAAGAAKSKASTPSAAKASVPSAAQPQSAMKAKKSASKH